ncbi:Premnaspirodiene oxygenase [Morella rubra]|uniref:Premnaspirodiene oxygenase n=1 Tax=Morella rubra TaxID=262757 RepID=A0A6A1VIC2_9ROSI|nr:Premnaspirodiene oxygenase [Morella rubra]
MLQLLSLSSPAFTWLSFFLFMVVFFWMRSKAKGQNHKLPPGPWKLPLLGNLHQLAFTKLPHRTLKDFADKCGPIMRLQLGEVLAIIISSPELAKDVLKIHDPAFAQRPSMLAVEVMSYDYSSMVFAPYGDYWRQMRKVSVMRLLSAKRVQSFRPVREEEVGNLIEFLYSSGALLPINISEEFYSLMNSITCRAAFGKKCKHEKEFTSLLNYIIKVGGGFDLHDLFPSLKFVSFVTGTKPALLKIQRKIDKILDNILDEHSTKRHTSSGGKDESAAADHHEEDIIDVLMNLQEAGETEINITRKQIKAITMDVVTAGSETSAGTLEWAMAELMKNPKVMEKAQIEVREIFGRRRKVDETDVQKLAYVQSVIKETLRQHPPRVLIPRESREKCKIGGYEIPSNTKVLVNAWAIGRDTNHWIDADSFRPERFLNSSIDFGGDNSEYLPFGAGRRRCPGISFAVANMELTLSQMLYHFNWKLPNDMTAEELDMTESVGVAPKKEKELYVIATPWTPLN